MLGNWGQMPPSGHVIRDSIDAICTQMGLPPIQVFLTQSGGRYFTHEQWKAVGSPSYAFVVDTGIKDDTELHPDFDFQFMVINTIAKNAIIYDTRMSYREQQTTLFWETICQELGLGGAVGYTSGEPDDMHSDAAWIVYQAKKLVEDLM